MGVPIRVLHVVVNMNRGGAETLIMNLYRNIDCSKVQFDFLTCKEGVFDEEIIKLGGKIHRIPYLTDVGHFKYMKELRSFFFTHSEYKIVHSHMDKMSGFVLREAQKANIPVRIAHSHNTNSEGSFVAKCYKWYAGSFVSTNATHLFACSNKAAKWLYGNKSNKSIVLKNGIDCNKFKYSADVKEKARTLLNIKKNSFVVGHIGRFSRQKNHTFLINIFAEIIRKTPNAKLVLVGDGDLKVDIEKKVKNIGLEDKVLFLGVRSDVHELLQSFDVMLFPSFHEGLPVSLVEAQGVGVPCVVSDSITKEVDMGAGLVKYINLKRTPQTWAENVLYHNTNVKDVTENIKSKGYDIKKTASLLQTFYLQHTLAEDKTKVNIV